MSDNGIHHETTASLAGIQRSTGSLLNDEVYTMYRVFIVLINMVFSVIYIMLQGFCRNVPETIRMKS